MLKLVYIFFIVLIVNQVLLIQILFYLFCVRSFFVYSFFFFCALVDRKSLSKWMATSDSMSE